VVLDPFCGCGTTISAAQKLGRNWIGIDLTHLAVNLIKWRLRHMFGLEPKRDYRVLGEPEDLAGAENLAQNDRFQFQWWVSSLIDARPYGDKKKGKDTGIDGYVYYYEDKDKIGKAIVSVKSGKVSVRDIRDLGHVIEREKSGIGIFVTLKPPTKDMVTEAVSKGFYRSKLTGRDYPAIQILTVEDILAGKRPEVPSQVSAVKKAEPVNTTKPLKLDF
jgi:site-specific DNA-methyltransferase (adenine-specific)